MRITFILPGRSVRPAGGFKVVYEYANRLTRRGHQVAVVHPWDCTRPESLRARIRAGLWIGKLRIRRSEIAPWFDLDDRVSLPVVSHPSAARLPASDVLIATAWHTAPWVSAASPEKGLGFYFIQGYETWDGALETVRATWRLPLRKIVISKWLEEIAIELGEGDQTSRVPIGMDLDRLGVDVPPGARGRRIGALLNPAREKGSEDIVAALQTVRQRDPTVSATVFGAAPRPASLPGWIEYTMLPDSDELRAFYNSCSIFLQASRSEGWGLPASEAMICGCALVTVENGGSREYAVDEETALVVAPEDAGDLADRILRLLGDDDLRLRLAERGTDVLRGYTWERAVEEFEGVLDGALAGAGTAR